MLGLSSVALSGEAPMARVIDMGKCGVSCIPGYSFLDLEALDEQYHPFEGAVEFCAYFNYLKNAFCLDTVIEIGTSSGGTTEFFRAVFDKTHKIEEGYAPSVLRKILPSQKKNRILLYLSPDTDGRWPLFQELEAISATHHDNCILVIDQIKVPDRDDIPYATFLGIECSYASIKECLDKIYSSYYYYYVIPKSLGAHAKCVVIPRRQEFSSGWYKG